MKGRALIDTKKAQQLPGILLRKKAIGDDRIQIKIKPYRCRQQQHHEAAVSQRPPQRMLVAAPARSPHAAPSACCPRRGRFLPWGGPAAKKSPPGLTSTCQHDSATCLTLRARSQDARKSGV